MRTKEPRLGAEASTCVNSEELINPWWAMQCEVASNCWIICCGDLYAWKWSLDHMVCKSLVQGRFTHMRCWKPLGSYWPSGGIDRTYWSLRGDLLYIFDCGGIDWIYRSYILYIFDWAYVCITIKRGCNIGQNTRSKVLKENLVKSQ